MQEQAPEEAPPVPVAAPCSVGARKKQGRDAELVSGSDHMAGATSPAPQASDQLSGPRSAWQERTCLQGSGRSQPHPL